MTTAISENAYGGFLLGPRTDFLSLIFQKDYKRVMIVLRVRKKGDK